jgi:hypothetical protein
VPIGLHPARLNRLVPAQRSDGKPVRPDQDNWIYGMKTYPDAMLMPPIL